MAWEAAEDTPKVLAACTYVGDPEKALSSWIWIDTAQAFAGTWGVKQ